LYDAGTQTSNCASLSALAQDAELRVNPTELERLGIQDGSEVTIISTKATGVAVAIADESVPRGTAVLPFNNPGIRANLFINSELPVTDIRIETR
jgi:anaerobic selenocysteine-containing dehydrogenase